MSGDYLAASSDRTRQQHALDVIDWLGWVPARAGERKALGDWLVDRALEHDAPSVVFRHALAHLRSERIVRPGLDRLTRAVVSARETAEVEHHRIVLPVLTEALTRSLAQVTDTDPRPGSVPIVWLGAGATSTSAAALKTEIAKLEHLRRFGADRLDLSMITPDRRRRLAQIARRSSPATLRRMSPQRRVPLLPAFLVETHRDLVDELVLTCDQALSGIENRTRRLAREQLLDKARANVGRLQLLDDILDVVLDPLLDDTTVGQRLRGLDRDRLHDATRPDPQRHPPADDGHQALIEDRYTQIRGFAPHVLAALAFNTSVEPSEILDAVDTLNRVNKPGHRHVPDDAPVGFIPARWRSYLSDTAEPRIRPCSGTTGSWPCSTSSEPASGRGRSGSLPGLDRHRQPAPSPTPPRRDRPRRHHPAR
jgi:hypothetical protein